MRITLCALIIIVELFISNLCLAFDHLTCKEFISLPEKEKVLVSRGLIDGYGAAVEIVDHAVRSVKKSYKSSVIALGADLTKSGVEYITVAPVSSVEKLSQQLDQSCKKENHQGRLAASELLDILMGISR